MGLFVSQGGGLWGDLRRRSHKMVAVTPILRCSAALLLRLRFASLCRSCFAGCSMGASSSHGSLCLPFCPICFDSDFAATKKNQVDGGMKFRVKNCTFSSIPVKAIGSLHDPDLCLRWLLWEEKGCSALLKVDLHGARREPTTSAPRKLCIFQQHLKVCCSSRSHAAKVQRPPVRLRVDWQQKSCQKLFESISQKLRGRAP